MFILYFLNEYFDYHHDTIYASWVDYTDFRVGESFWLLPGTDPEDPLYCW